jgi:nitrite reductase/ring-hydroxylating ferredoxin subunit
MVKSQKSKVSDSAAFGLWPLTFDLRLPGRCVAPRHLVKIEAYLLFLEDHLEDPAVSRRAFERWTLIAMPLVYAVGFLVAVVRYLLPPPSRRQPRLDVGPVVELPAGEVKPVKFNGRLIYVFRDGKAVRALDATCTHLTCRVNWKAKERQFYCYCHGGVYSAAGERLAGPPPRPLRAQPFEVTPAGRIVLLDGGEEA